jgi:chitinase
VPGLPGLGVRGVAPGDLEGRGHGVIPYYEVEMLLLNPEYVRYWDDEAKVPYLFNARTGRFISYDDPESVSIKVDYILEGGFGGAIIWDLSGDTRVDQGTSGRSVLGNILRRLID